MKAIVKTQSNYRNLNGKTLNVHEICGTRVTCWVYAWELLAYILADFTTKEVTFIADSERIGESVYLERNQGERQGYIIAVNKQYYVVQYEMPNGSTWMNLISDLNNTKKYKTISHKEAIRKGIINQ